MRTLALIGGFAPIAALLYALAYPVIKREGCATLLAVAAFTLGMVAVMVGIIELLTYGFTGQWVQWR